MAEGARTEPVAAAPAPARPGAPASAEGAEADDTATLLEVTRGLRLRIDDVQGTTAAEAGALFAEVADPLEKCAGVEPGTVNVRVVADGERTVMEVAPGTNADADTRACVLAALAMVDEQAEEDDGRLAGSAPTDPPRGFASTVNISW